jgi:glycosyltransferase involved in cell wall biosynthesis
LKVLHISYSNDTGGAARAAHRINESLNVLGIKSEICIVKTSSKNKNLNTTYPKNFFDKDILKIKILFAKLFQILCCSFREKISFNIIPSFYSKFINKSDFDLVNIHWIGNETISFDDIQKINKPIVWTMHDMSPFLPIKHYTLDNCDDNSIIKFFSTINFKRKKKLYQNINNFIAVSSWLKMQAENSELLNKKKINKVANTIDTDFWVKSKINTLRKKYKIPDSHLIIGFGGLFDIKNPYKGIDSLNYIIKSLNKKHQITFVTIGNNKILVNQKKINIINLGYLSRDKKILEFYSSLDIYLNLSSKEAFGQTVLEAQSCSVPCIIFNNTGSTDIISKKKNNGWIFKKKQINLLVSKLIKLSKNNKKLKAMKLNSRNNAVNNFGYNIIARKYVKIYKNCIKN